MGDTPWVTDSTDGGVNLNFNNVFGNDLWNRSPRNFDQVIYYDELQRKVKVRTKGIKNDGTVATDNVVETFIYGESQPNAADYNLRGQLYQLRDQSGVITNSKYNLQGNILETNRQLTQNYQDYINWDDTVELETESYTSKFAFNGIQQLITETTPDGSVKTNSYNRLGLLEKIKVTFPDGTEQPIINNIKYNAKGQRVAIDYANGVKTSYSYEDTTWRLIKLYSTRSNKDSKGKERKSVIQDIAYTYDPVGNITRLKDNTYQTVFYNNQRVEPVSDYTYDPLYRLIKANGRQHPGINARTHKNNDRDEDFKQSKFIPLSDSNALENYRESYTYDDAGNLIETTHIASNPWTRNQEIMPDSNRLKTVSSNNGFPDSLDITYDRSGNQQQLNGNSTVSLTFNCCENLVKAGIIARSNQPDDSDYYTYDSDEMRTRKVSERLVNGGAVIEKESKIYLGNYEVKRLQQNETTILKRQTLRVMDDETCVAIIHYWERDDLQREVEQVGTRKLRYQLDNHLGSVSLEVNDDAQIISYEEYFPYGGTAFIAGKNQKEVKLKEYRYSGKERDEATGLYYYGARYYAPWLGRWLKPDPAGSVDGLNLYEFVGGNPISNVDIGGLALANYTQTGGAEPANIQNFDIQSRQENLAERRKEKKKTGGYSFLSFGLFGLNKKKQSGKRKAGKTKEIKLKLSKNTKKRKTDQQEIEQSIENISQQSERVQKRLSQNRGSSAPQTEIIGEVAAFMVNANKQNRSLAYPVAPGHGTGFDQVWIEGTPSNPTAFHVVEAKGPTAKLAKGRFGRLSQMSKPWVRQKTKELANSRDPKKKKVGQKMQQAMASGNPPIYGETTTAKWDTKKGTLTGKTSRSQKYN